MADAPTARLGFAEAPQQLRTRSTAVWVPELSLARVKRAGGKYIIGLGVHTAVSACHCGLGSATRSPGG